MNRRFLKSFKLHFYKYYLSHCNEPTILKKYYVKEMMFFNDKDFKDKNLFFFSFEI